MTYDVSLRCTSVNEKESGPHAILQCDHVAQVATDDR